MRPEEEKANTTSEYNGLNQVIYAMKLREIIINNNNNDTGYPANDMTISPVVDIDINTKWSDNEDDNDTSTQSQPTDAIAAAAADDDDEEEDFKMNEYNANDNQQMKTMYAKRTKIVNLISKFPNNSRLRETILKNIQYAKIDGTPLTIPNTLIQQHQYIKRKQQEKEELIKQKIGKEKVMKLMKQREMNKMLSFLEKTKEKIANEHQQEFKQLYKKLEQDMRRLEK